MPTSSPKATISQTSSRPATCSGRTTRNRSTTTASASRATTRTSHCETWPSANSRPGGTNPTGADLPALLARLEPRRVHRDLRRRSPDVGEQLAHLVAHRLVGDADEGDRRERD